MNLEDLTQEELALLNTDFGDEMEKQASAYVDEAEAQAEESVKVASGCQAMGEEIAVKIAEELEKNYDEAKKEEEKEPKKEEEKTEEEKKEEILDKEASVRGAIIFESTIQGLEKLGQDRYGDPRIYIEELVKQSGAMDKIKALLGSAKAMGSSAASKVKSHAKSVAGKAKSGAQGMKSGTKDMYQGIKTKNPELRAAARKQILEGARRMAPAAGYGAGALLGGGGYAANRKK